MIQLSSIKMDRYMIQKNNGGFTLNFRLLQRDLEDIMFARNDRVGIILRKIDNDLMRQYFSDAIYSRILREVEDLLLPKIKPFVNAARDSQKFKRFLEDYENDVAQTIVKLGNPENPLKRILEQYTQKYLANVSRIKDSALFTEDNKNKLNEIMQTILSFTKSLAGCSEIQQRYFHLQKSYSELSIKKEIHLLIKMREFEIFFSLYDAMNDYDIPEIPEIKVESQRARNRREKKDMKARFKHEEKLNTERNLVAQWKKNRAEKKDVKYRMGGEI